AGVVGLFDLTPGLADDLAGGGLIGLVESADGSVGQRQRGPVAGVVDLRLFEFIEAVGVAESAQGRVDGLFHGGLVQGVELICHLCPSVRVVWTECLFIVSLSSPAVASGAVSAG